MSGVPTGFDLPALLELADSQGYDRSTMAQLIPFAEAGLLEAVQEREEREGD